MEVEVVYAEPKYFESFRQTLDSVAKENVYIEMTEAKSLKETSSFMSSLISRNLPVFYAVNTKDEVIGWADITPLSSPRLAHRGVLGMGIRSEFRGQGIGQKLLEKAIQHAKHIGLEKVELTVYTSNTGAQALYKKLGFVEVGFIKHYRKLKDRYFDVIEMELFL